MDTSGNTVLITGGSSGIGYAMAQAFLAAGSEVIICARREDRLLEARKQQPGVHTRRCDLANEQDRSALVQWALASFGKLNVLVNNAGVQRDIDFSQGIGEFLAGENEIRINLEAPIILTGLLIPHLRAQKNAVIVNVSSGLGFVPAAKMPVYSASKAGMHAFSMAIRRQLSPLGIKVFEVVPPAVDTALNSQGRAQRGGFRANLGPAEFVAAVMKGLANDVFEIGYGMTTDLLEASRAELDKSFERMNSGW
jgi:uncharacterized oxidoreductase